jgi:hypothetical protein
MKCKNCNQEIKKNDKGYYHVLSENKCDTLKAEPAIKEVGTFVCNDWNNCIHGAGCNLSTFNYENKPKEDPDIVFENGIFYCKTWKKG